MREHLATLLSDFREHEREIAIVRYQGVRRRVTTYGELARLAGRFAAFLEERAIGMGDRVLLWGDNSAEWVAAFYGCMLRGVMVVPLDAFGSAEFAQRVTADVKPRLVVGDAAMLAKLAGGFLSSEFKLQRLSSGVPMLAFEEWSASLPARESGPVSGLSRETPLQILFTSGTTGDPKGIVHTHGNVLASVAPIEQAAQGYLMYERVFHPLRILHTLPLSHVFGQTMGLWIPPIFAAEVHFETRLVASRLMEMIKRERISVLAAVPRVMALLKAHLENIRPGLAERVGAAKGMNPWRRWWVFRDVHRALGLKFWALVSGGGALAGLLEQFWNSMGFVVVQGYGMTETTALITLNHPFHVASGTIGKPLPGREVKIGQDGEVMVKGPMISTATWSGGKLRQRPDEWLSTGDLAEEQATGELRFMGRKSETIVTAAGVNVHPEDLEAVLEDQPEIAASAVVPVETAAGPEPCAVLALHGGEQKAEGAVDRANAKLAEFQRVRRWVVWPEPDLPRTPTGKVRRKAVADWVREHRTSNGSQNGSAQKNGRDWLYTLVAEIAGERPLGHDELRLSEDFHLDSLGRVQLAAALEEKLGDSTQEGSVDAARTLGELKRLISEDRSSEFLVQNSHEELSSHPDQKNESRRNGHPDTSGQRISLPMAQTRDLAHPESTLVEDSSPANSPDFVYPHWPWWKPVEWMRSAFLELLAQPLVWFLGNPRVIASQNLPPDQPMLIICNHVTAYDGALVQYALPGRMRRRVAAAMLGELLEDFRHFRDPDTGRFLLLGPVAYWLVTALYNVFPLPRRKDFQRSFAHAGEALDRGYNVLVFPEGTRSAEGKLARFRPGIGLLVKQAQTAVLPVAITGLGELKAKGRGWFRSGKIEVRVGQPLRFGPLESESAITERLQATVANLMQDPGIGTKP